MKNKKKLIKISFIFLITLLILILIAVYLKIEYGFENEQIKYPENYVLEVIDGDTFIVMINNEKTKIRLLCIDAPEIDKINGYESKKYLENLILGKIVRLERDFSDKDEYNRLLRYVYIGDIFVNKDLFENNYAKILKIEPDVSKCDF